MRLLRSLSCVLAILAPGAQADTTLVVGSGDSALEERLVAASSLMGGFEPDTPVADQIATARSEYGRLIAVLYEQGYFGAVISIEIDGREAANISPLAGPARIDDIEIRVDPGRPFRLAQASIGPLAPGTQPIPGFQSGAEASTSVLRDAARAAIEGWRDDGHAVARVADQDIIARNRDAELDAAITIDPGPQLRFGAFVPSGTERMTSARAAEIAGLPVGTVFSPAELERAAARLRRTGVFSSVALSEAAPNPDGTIDIEAELVEAPLRRLGFGAELSSTEGLALSAFWLHRNLTGGGEQLRFDAEVTGIGQDAGDPDGRIGAAFSRPATATPDTTFTAELAAEYLDEDTFQSLIFEGQLGVEQQISDALTGTVALGFRFSDVSDDFGDRKVTLLTVPSSARFDTRDDSLDATSGLYAELDLIPFYATEAQSFGARTDLDLRAYRAFGEAGRTRVAGQLQLGTISGGAITDLPPDYLFFSGGSGTVRGQDFRGLGAVQSGVETGGRSFAGFSAELRQDVTDTFGAVAFYDIGMITADEFWGGDSTTHAGAGLGLRYATPLGAIRLDVAVPVSGPDPAEDVFVYIGIGQAF